MKTGPSIQMHRSIIQVLTTGAAVFLAGASSLQTLRGGGGVEVISITWPDEWEDDFETGMAHNHPDVNGDHLKYPDY